MDLRQILARLAKADFADAVGVALSSDSVAIAHLRKRFHNVSVLARVKHPLDAPPEGRWTMTVNIVRDFVAVHGLDGARLVVALERRHTLYGQLQLPAAATEDIASVVGYELERLVPVPSSALHAQHYVRSMGSSGERIAVSVVAGFRAQVEQAYREFAAAALPLSAVTAVPVALSDYYAFQRAEQNRTAGLCYADGDRECLTVACDGLMVSTVHFDPGAETRSERLLRELERVAPEKAGEPVEIVAEVPGTDEKSFASIAAEAPFAVVGPPENWLEAAAIGAALAILGEARHRINLLPAEMAKAEQGVGIRELALGAAVVTLAVALMGSTAVKNLSVNNALAAEVARLAPKVSQVSRQEDENRKLLAQIDLIEK
jgi:hypothetical protein